MWAKLSPMRLVRAISYNTKHPSTTLPHLGSKGEAMVIWPMLINHSAVDLKASAETAEQVAFDKLGGCSLTPPPVQDYQRLSEQHNIGYLY